MTLEQARSRRNRLHEQLKNVLKAIADETANPVRNAYYLQGKKGWVSVLTSEIRSIDKLISIILFEEKRLKLMQELLDLRVLIGDCDASMVTADADLRKQYKEKLRIFMDMNAISIRRDRSNFRDISFYLKD